MKQWGVAIVAVALAFGVSAMAQTSSEQPAAPPAAPPMLEIEHVVGKLIKIDHRDLTIEATVEGKAKEVVITCNRGTRIFNAVPRPPEEAAHPAEKAAAGQQARGRFARLAAKFDDLKVGQQLRAFYHADDNVAVAVAILAEAPAAKEAPKEAPAQ